MSMRLIVAPDSLTKSKGTSPVFGEVYLQDEGYAFPQRHWTDFAAAFCLYWMNALQTLESGDAQKSTVHFYDGPFKVELRAAAHDSVELQLVDCRKHDEVVRHTTCMPIKTLLHDAVLNARTVLRVCQQNEWVDPDIEALASVLRA